MQPLPSKMPGAISEEKPAKNLASLVMSDGLDALKSVLIKQWIQSKAFVDLKQYGIRPLDRALFYGPPGNGKTMAAQVIASELACPLYRVRCEGLLESTFGGSEKSMASVLDWVSQQGQSVVLFDECETLFPDRTKGGTDACTQAVNATMQVFWQRLDRWETPQLFLLATNMIDRIDGALVSRIDLKLEFGPPSREDALKVVRYWEEILHEYGAAEWGPRLKDEIEASVGIESFRTLWQAIASAVRTWVTENS